MKLLCVDLDGTLLDSEKNISKANLSAINKMVEEGHRFAIVTGRPLKSALKVAKENNLSRPGMYVASFNGGQIYDCMTGKVIYEARMPMEYASVVFERARQAGLHIHTYDDTYVVCEKQDAELDFYLKNTRLEGKITDDPLNYIGNPPIKLIVMSLKGREVLEEFRDSLLDWSTGRLSSIFSNPVLLEYSSPEIGKDKAVEMLCKLTGVSIEDAIACGDEENDLSMIKAAGLGVAMANATEPVKASADYITERTNDESGIEEVISRFVL